MDRGRDGGMLVGLAMVIGLGLTGLAQAQERRSAEGGPQADRTDQARPREERDRDFAYPPKVRRSAERGRPRYPDPHGRPPRRYPRRFDLRPQFYYDGYAYRFGVPAFEGLHNEQLEHAYRQGIEDGRNLERFEIQSERGLAAYQQAMVSGHAAFAERDYGLAARQFLLAATLNQGDPASRLCAANAQMALGDYEPAVRLLHRAFELQPKLVYLPMDIRGPYENREDFTKHLDALRDAAARTNDNGDLWFLLGYYYYYSNDMSKAAEALGRATKLQPEDRLIAELSALARMSAPRSGKRPEVQNSQVGGENR